MFRNDNLFQLAALIPLACQESSLVIYIFTHLRLVKIRLLYTHKITRHISCRLIIIISYFHLSMKAMDEICSTAQPGCIASYLPCNVGEIEEV